MPAVRPYKILYTVSGAQSKPVEFRGSSLKDLRAFPLTARREAPRSWASSRPAPDRFAPDATDGLSFQKKTETTSKADVELAAKRYRELSKELGQ
jgi:hypothetical protein